MKILAVDDSPTMRDLVSQTLIQSGYSDIEMAIDGVDALEKINDSEEEFEFFIIDINMPRMDGFELISNLRNMFDYMSTPIMVLTTERSDEMKQKGREVGATSWIVKPFDQEKFTDGIQLTLDYVNRNETF
jgi:two-component system, chemotaxis family, chemotaxis protein CheY